MLVSLGIVAESPGGQNLTQPWLDVYRRAVFSFKGLETVDIERAGDQR
jgi:hypothetical protein